MNSRKRVGRTAGALYLVLVLCGIFHLMYIPVHFVVWDNPSLTLANIQASPSLFRIGVLVGIIGYIDFILLPLALYRLLHAVDHIKAVLMVALALASVPISLINMLNKFSILTLIKANQSVDPAVVMQYLSSYRDGNQLASIFWGLWLLPFGYLVVKSGFLPKLPGYLLMAGCFGYLINFTGIFMFEAYPGSLLAQFVTIPGSLGEIGICLWLLVYGAKETKSITQ